MLEKQFELTGFEPQALIDRPSASIHLLWVLDAFHALSMYRTWREGIPDPITFSNAVEFSKLHHLENSDDIFEFCALITGCDSAYISHYIKVASQKMELAKSKRK